MELLVIMLLLGIYTLPIWVALLRGSDKTAPVVVVNLFLGWTLVGWVVALAMAVWRIESPPSGGSPEAPRYEPSGERRSPAENFLHASRPEAPRYGPSGERL